MNSEEKKAAVERLYNSVLLKGNKQVAEELLHENYKKHNPQAEDGRDGLLTHVAIWKRSIRIARSSLFIYL